MIVPDKITIFVCSVLRIGSGEEGAEPNSV